MTNENTLSIGDPAPWFTARSTANSQFHFDTVGGRYVVLCFFESAADDGSRRILDDLLEHRRLFDDKNLCFFGVTTDPDDERKERVKQVLPGIRFFWDFDRSVSRLCGAVSDSSSSTYRRHTLVLDPRLRVLGKLNFGESPEEHVPRLLKFLSKLPSVGQTGTATLQAPILVVPSIFEPELCQTLISYYEEHGGYESGFMREVDGKTVMVYDHAHKRRQDQEISDEQLRKACMFRIHDRLVPEVFKAFQYRATRIERYIVACYDAAVKGHFQAHRDNRTKGTAHRRFAVSLNLNTGEYEGGNLRFPEFGRQDYSAPRGGAVVFSCSMLHEATPVTEGTRYAFLPFLYDDEAAKIREQNLKFIENP